MYPSGKGQKSSIAGRLSASAQGESVNPGSALSDLVKRAGL